VPDDPARDAPAARLRLGPDRRLRRSADFKRLYATGRRFGNERFSAVVLANSEGMARLGLSVAARTLRRAVDRNRVRRLIRESFRLHQLRLPAVDIVVGVRNPVREANNSQLRGSLERLWQKISTACEPSSAS
jgi:ribonuclease P protein component